jgi:hypothetical protein
MNQSIEGCTDCNTDEKPKAGMIMKSYTRYISMYAKEINGPSRLRLLFLIPLADVVILSLEVKSSDYARFLPLEGGVLDRTFHVSALFHYQSRQADAPARCMKACLPKK